MLDAIDREIASSVSHHVDAGIELSLVGAATREAFEPGVGLDVVLGVFGEPRDPHHPRIRDRLRDRIADRIADRIVGGHAIDTPRRQGWPILARPRLELHLGGQLGVDGDRQQARLGIGTGLGPIGVGLGATLDHTDHLAFALSPEVRLRHRVGPQPRSPSFGGFVRADVFVDRGEADRISFGIFGLFDLY
ncbi:MAG: hypothetical protein NT062_34590 [Proteobacteria bacterium]|nr:hypothetical protein [Pseudomonadota bacterium]